MINRFKVITVWLIINAEHQVLLWKRSETEDAFPWYRAIPWGKVELDWTEDTRNILEKSVQRELEEEVGIQVGECKYLSSHYGHNWWEFKLYIAFTAKHLWGIPQALDETEEIKFFDINDTADLKLAPNVATILSQLSQVLK